MFLGTEVEPDEDAFKAFLTRHGGSSNAFTGMEATGPLLGWAKRASGRDGAVRRVFHVPVAARVVVRSRDECRRLRIPPQPAIRCAPSLPADQIDVVAGASVPQVLDGQPADAATARVAFMASRTRLCGASTSSTTLPARCTSASSARRASTSSKLSSRDASQTFGRASRVARALRDQRPAVRRGRRARVVHGRATRCPAPSIAPPRRRRRLRRCPLSAEQLGGLAARAQPVREMRMLRLMWELPPEKTFLASKTLRLLSSHSRSTRATARSAWLLTQRSRSAARDLGLVLLPLLAERLDHLGLLDHADTRRAGEVHRGGVDRLWLPGQPVAHLWRRQRRRRGQPTATATAPGGCPTTSSRSAR